MAFGGTDFRTDREMKTEITPILCIQRRYIEAQEADKQSNMALVSHLRHTHIQRRSCGKAEQNCIRKPLTRTCPTYTPHGKHSHGIGNGAEGFDDLADLLGLGIEVVGAGALVVDSVLLSTSHTNLHLPYAHTWVSIS